jgi:hypothetical protein
MAETEGFEPSKPISGLAHLANECLQPLGHVSMGVSYGFARSRSSGNGIFMPAPSFLAHKLTLAPLWVCP